MLQKSLRIQRDADFSRVYRSGTRSHTKHFVVTSARNTLNRPRFACVVPKTVSKKAVVRNRIRRLVHEALAAELIQNKELSLVSSDILISAKKGSDLCTLNDIASELAPTLAKYGKKTR